MRYHSIRILVKKDGKLVGEVENINVDGDLEVILCYNLFRACYIHGLSHGLADTYEIKVQQKEPIFKLPKDRDFEKESERQAEEET